MTASPVRQLSQGIDVTIPSGSAVTSRINLVGRVLTGIIMPANWTAASLTFQGHVGVDGTPQNIFDSAGNELSVTAAASRFIPINPVNFYGVNFLIIRSGTSGAAVNQAADRVLTLCGAIPAIDQ